MGCSLLVFLEEYFFVYSFSQAFIQHSVFLSSRRLARPNLNWPHKWVYYSIISKLMLSFLDLLQVPSDVIFETLTAEVKSLLLEEKNRISDWLRKLKIKCSCWFVVLPFWEEKKNGIFGGVSSFRWSWKFLCSALVSRSEIGHVDVCPSELQMYFFLMMISSVSADGVFSFVVGFFLFGFFVEFPPLMNNSFSKFSCGFFFF